MFLSDPPDHRHVRYCLTQSLVPRINIWTRVVMDRIAPIDKTECSSMRFGLGRRDLKQRKHTHERDVFSTRVFMQVNRKFDFVCAILASSAPRFYPLVFSGSVCQFVPLAVLHPVVFWLFREPLYWDILLAGGSHPFSLAGCVVWPTAFV